jgi:hypothetical protein
LQELQATKTEAHKPSLTNSDEQINSVPNKLSRDKKLNFHAKQKRRAFFPNRKK